MAPAGHEVVGALEVGARAHRRAEYVELLPPQAVQRRRGIRAGGRPADDDTSARPDGVEGALPGGVSDRLDDHVGAPAGRLLHRCDHVAFGGGRPRRRRRAPTPARASRALPDVTIVRAPSACAIRNAAVATPPPIPQIRTHSSGLERGPRDEHPVGGLVDEREGGRLLERETVAERIDIRRRYRCQLGMNALRVLADHVDDAVVLETRVDHHRLARLQAGDTCAERLDDACPVGAQDPGLRHRGEPLAGPHVEVVERGRAHPDQHLAGPRDRIRDVLVAEDLGPAVLVDDDRLHGPIV